MTDRHGEPTRRLLRVAVAVALAAAWAAVGRADDPPAARGGLVPAPRKTREERVREWDLNSDGKIDQSEAEIASSRMRRERAELRLNSGIDPVTGLPRGESASLTDPGDADLAVEPAVPEDEPADEPDPDERPALPRSRVPKPPVPGSSGTAAPKADGSRAAADIKRQPLTGGVKAGGLPARAGYGAGVPATPLNAGLPIPTQPRAAAGGATAARGGLVPTPRSPTPAPRTPPPSRSRDMYDPY